LHAWEISTTINSSFYFPILTNSTDLFVIGCDETCVKVYLWDSNAWAFSELTTAQVNVTGSAGSVVITNVVASDFNFDGALDIMITTKLTAPGDGDIQMVSDIYAGNRNSLRNITIKLLTV
jgi:hypothetical protein